MRKTFTPNQKVQIAIAVLKGEQSIVNGEDIVLMGLIDKIYTDYPFYGSRRIRYELSQTNKFYLRAIHSAAP